MAGTLTKIGRKESYKQVISLLESGGYNGLPGEIMEEYVGYCYDMLFGHGKQALSELKDPRTHLDIMLGCATTGALMGALPLVVQGEQSAQYFRYKNRVSKRDKAARATFGDPKQWDELRDKIDNTPNEQMTDKAESIILHGLSEEQKKAVADYILNLQRMRGYSIGVLNAEQEQAAEQSVKADMSAQRDAGIADTEPQQMHERQVDMEVADAMMEAVVGKEVADRVRQSPESIVDLAASGEYTDEQLAAMRRYADASSHVSGIRERMQQEADAEVQQRMQQIDSITNKDTGEIITVHETDVNGNPLVDEEGRSVMRHVTAGKLVLRADGTIDTDASTASVTLLNPTTGEVEMVSPSDIHAESIVAGSAEELRKASESSIRQEVSQRYDATLRGGNPDVSRGGAEFRIVGYDGTPCTVRLASGANGEAVANTEGALLCDVVDEGNGQVAGQVNLTPSQLRDLSHRRAVQERIDAERSMMQQGATPASAAQPFTVGQSLTLSDGQGGVVRGDVIDDADENGRITVALDKPMPDGSETLLLSPEELQGMVVQDVENGQENVGKEEEGGSGERKVNVSATPASDRVPRGKNGELLYEDVDADTAWDALVEQCRGDAAMALRVAQQMVRSRKDALDKVKKKGADKADTPEQAIAAERAYANLLSAAEKSLALWNDISAVQSLREQAAAEKEQEQKREATNDREKESVGNYVKLQADTEEKDENENAPLHQQEQQHAAADATDAQGNPVNPDGTLKLEKITSVDELTDEDFSNPTRNVELPALPENVDKAIVANGKPVVIKKNIFEKNKRNHSELSPSQSRSILKEALYFTNLYGRTQPKSRPNYWVAIRTSERNKLVVLEVSEKKDNVEIVGWRYAGERQIEELRKQAEREDGQLLILTSTKEAAAGLSTLPSDVSNDKDTQATSDVQAPAAENAENASVEKEANLVDVIKSVWNALTQERKTDEEIERDVRSLLETFSKPTFNSVIASYLASLHTKNPQFLKALSRFERALKGMGITVKQGANRIAAGDVVLTSAYDKAGYVTGHIVQSVHSKSEIKKQKESINSLVAIASNQSNAPTERANALNELRTIIPHYGGKILQDGQFVDDRVSINEYLDSIEGIKVDGKDKTLPRFKINGYYRVKNTNKTKEGKASHGAQGVDLAKQHKSGESSSTEPVSEAESALRDALMGKLQEAGIEVVTDAEEAQRVLDEVNGEARMQAKKRALETASLSEGSERSLTVVSSADGAKVLRNLDKAIQTLESSPTQPKTFVGDIANSLGAQRKGSKSEYATFETKNGRVVTIRLADHNATVSNFDRRGELDGISIVVSPKKSAGVTNDGEAHVVEYYYDAIKLRRADGKPLADIVRAIKQALYSGEFKDTTGLAERQEVNARELRQSVGVKMQKKPMTAEEQKHKETQLSIIHDTNPAPDDYHTWVRSIDDILTLQEAMDAVLAEDPEYELSAYPDVSDDMIREALRTGRITIYSSKPIKNGVFVTPSMMQAMDYSGGTKVFSKEVPIGNVAWINTDEGQYAATSGEATSQDKELRFFRTPDGHAYGFTVGGKIYIDPRIAKADTPIHEYTHLWAAAVRQGDAKAWADIVRLMQGTPLWDEVAQHYPELADDVDALADDVDALADEVLAHFSGRRGAERLREAQRAAMEQEGLDAQAAAVAAVERVRQALKRFWRKVADFFGRRFTTAEEVADTVLADMLHGVKPSFDAKDGGVRYDANSEEAGIVARAKADGTYMKAPNGQPSKLTPRQWVQVRTRAFKEWFGDWAKAARIEKLRKSKPIVRKGDEYKGKYELNSRSAEDYVIHSLRGEYPNNDTGDVIRITRASRKVAHHDAENEVHLRSIAYIPEMIKNAVFIEESPNEKGSKFDSYRYYVVGVKIGGVDYTAKLVVGVKDGESYYDHSLTEIEKNNLIDLTDGVKADVSGNEAAPFTGKDKRLLSILQTNSSKVVDENGEPRVVYHGTQEEFNAFDKDAVRERGDGVKGFFFAPAARRESVAGYYAQHGGSIMPVFLNLKRPLVLSTSENLEAPGIADGYDGIISTAASDSESRYYDYEQKRVATERLNKGDIVEIVAFEPSQIKSAEENVGTFDGSNHDIRYQFVGERGAAAMDKAEEASVRLDNLAVAREMEAEGKDAKAVKLATGWERGADGKWRYEIGDGKLKEGWKEKAIRVEGASLHDVLDNPELFASYPDMRNVTVSLESLDDGTYGEYRPNSNTIALNDNVLLGMENVIAHEVQHAIQHIEGFATGGNLNSVRSIVKRIIDSNKDAAEYAREQYKHASRLELLAGNLNTGLYRMKVTVGTEKFVNQAVDAYWEAMNEIDSDPNAELVNEYPSGMSPLEVAKSAYHLEEAEKELKRLAEYYRDSVPEGNEQALETVNRLEKALLNYSNFQLYKMIAGEVEARNVAKRLDMSEEERRRTLAEETEDVARKDQIFLHDGIGVSLMGSRVDGRMEEVGKHYKNKSLGVNERKVVDVYSGASKNETITLMRDGKEHKVVMRQGTENNAGTKHSLLRHYGTGTGVISNEDILLVPQVIESGELEEKGKKRVYRIVKDGIRYTVLTEVKNGREEFSDFYSNKKGDNTSPSNTQLSARDYDVTTNFAAKVDEETDNTAIPNAKKSETDGDTLLLREGDGVVSDAVLSEENDALGKMGIERTEEERAAFAERERARMERMAHRVAEELGLDEDAVQVVTDVNEITEPKLRKAKGWFDPKTGKITVVIPNHTGTGDVLRTMLHEAVAHKGLRGLFGKRFDVFLDNVYAAADETVRRRISTLASQHGWDFRRATEEYLAGLAEDMHFEHVSPSFWQKIKLLFLQMLDRLGIRGYDSVTLTDNELRYVLWRSYQHMAHAGRYRSMEEVADKADAERASEEDDAVRRSLRVGEYSDATADAAEAERAYAAERAADEAGMDVLLRDGAEEDAASRFRYCGTWVQ